MVDDGILDLVSDAVIAFAVTGEIRLWNAGAARLYGVPADRAIGQNLHDMLSGHHQFGTEALMKTLAERGRWEGELRRTTAAGQAITVEVVWTLQPSGDIVEVGRDLGQLSQLEQDTRAAAHRYRNIFQAMAASFWELDFSAVRGMIGALFASGVTDLRTYFRDHPEWIDAAMKNTRVVDVNEATLQLFGASVREDIVGGNVAFSWPLESRGLYAEALMAAVERRDKIVAESVFTALDGRRIEALFTVCWPTEHQGRGNVLVGVIDITARKKVETELRQSELRYRSLFQHMPIAMWQMKTGEMRDALAGLRKQGITDLKAYSDARPQFLDWVMTQLQVVEVNDRAVEMLGAQSRGDLLGNFSRLWSNRDALLNVVEARLGGAESFTLEATIDSHDGRRIDVLTSVAFPEELSREGFNQAGMIDITDRSLARAALEQSEERYRHLFHYMPISMWQLDSSALAGFFRDFRAAGIIDLAAHLEAHPQLLHKMMDSIPALVVNDHTVTLFSGTSVQDFVGHSITRNWAANPGTIIRSFAARYDGDSGYSEETEVRTLDGRDIAVQFNITFATPLADKGISLVGVVDISERIAAQAQLEQTRADFAHASRVATLGELTASIAHEVNQPLTAIAIGGETALRWLSRPEPDLDEVRDLAGRIVDDARRAADIISRIRDMARNRAPVHAPLSVAGVVDEAVAFMEAELRHRTVALHLALEAGLPMVLCDRIQIQQVIANLVLNASQAMNDAATPRPTIWITGVAAGPLVTITVSDNGPGLPPTGIDRLFQGFVSTKSGGLGIGLSICRTIVEAHGGTISGHASAQGGARFEFTLRTCDAA